MNWFKRPDPGEAEREIQQARHLYGPSKEGDQRAGQLLWVLLFRACAGMILVFLFALGAVLGVGSARK